MGDTNKVVNLFQPELSADDVLDAAKGELTDVLVIGYNKDGSLDVRSTNMDAKSVAFMVQVFLRKLYAGEYSDA